MGETRVDLQHLLEDLRDAYAGPLEETILTEVVANALDSGATRIRLLTNAADATFTIVDDGRGMLRRELARFHDVAASSKRRGEGIGFAGVGIKLGLLISREVVTETRRSATHVATRWHLASRQRAPWKWIPPEGLAHGRGTAVKLILTNQLSLLLDAGYIEETIRKHFEPLLEPAFDEILRRKYRAGVIFEVDGRVIAASASAGAERAPMMIRVGRSRTASAVGFLERHPSLPADRQGIAISTYGKAGLRLSGAGLRVRTRRFVLGTLWSLFRVIVADGGQAGEQGAGRTGASRRQHRLDQRRASGLYQGRRITVARVPHGTGGGALARVTRGGTCRRARFCHPVSRAVGEHVVADSPPVEARPGTEECLTGAANTGRKEARSTSFC